MLFLFQKKKVSFNLQELKAYRKKIRLINLNKYNNFPRASRRHNTHCNSHSKKQERYENCGKTRKLKTQRDFQLCMQNFINNI